MSPGLRQRMLERFFFFFPLCPAVTSDGGALTLRCPLPAPGWHGCGLASLLPLALTVLIGILLGRELLPRSLARSSIRSFSLAHSVFSRFSPLLRLPSPPFATRPHPSDS